MKQFKELVKLKFKKMFRNIVFKKVGVFFFLVKSVKP